MYALLCGQIGGTCKIILWCMQSVCVYERENETESEGEGEREGPGPGERGEREGESVTSSLAIQFGDSY